MNKNKIIPLIPHKIKIGCTEYDVKFVDSTTKVCGSDFDAFISFDTQVIGIKDMTDIDDYHINNYTKSFLHEIIHGIIEEYQIDLMNDKEERIVESLARGIWQVIQQLHEFKGEHKYE